MTDANDPSGSALGRGLAVLSAFKHAEEWIGNGELAARTGLPKSTVSRVATTLVQLNFLDYSATEQRYRLGAGTLDLVGRASRFEAVRRVMRPAFQILADSAGASVGAAYLTSEGLSYFEYCRSESPVILSLGVGSVVPLCDSAVGSAYLAGASEEEYQRVLARTGNETPDREAIERQREEALAEMKADGFCRSFGRWKPEINSIAIPYRLPGSGMLTAISLGGASYMLSGAALEGWLHTELKACLRSIDRQFGRTSLKTTQG